MNVTEPSESTQRLTHTHHKVVEDLAVSERRGELVAALLQRLGAHRQAPVDKMSRCHRRVGRGHGVGKVRLEEGIALDGLHPKE